MRRDREHKLDLADIGGETGASNHNLAMPRAPMGWTPSNVSRSISLARLRVRKISSRRFTAR
jgi:hypothetical protein